MITGIGLAVVANSLAAVKKLVFEDGVCTMAELAAALRANWEGYEDLQARAKACPKYGNDEDAVDDLAIRLANHFYEEIHPYHDIFGAPFLTAFMGISNYIPMGRVLGPPRTAESTGNPPARGSPLMWGPTNPTPLAAMQLQRQAQPGGPFRGNPAEPAAEPRVVATKRGRPIWGA